MTEVVERPPTLAQKLVEAAKAIGAVEKAGRNQFHNYSYAGIEDVVNAVRDELLNRGVLVLAGEESINERQRQTNQGEATVTTVHLVFTLMDADTGETMELAWAGRGEDPADKGLAKALTDARKTFLVQQLNLARGDDNEADPTTDARSYATTPSGTVNLVSDAKGLSDTKLNEVLVACGLAAQKMPFGTFARIPSDKADAVRVGLAAQKGSGG